MVAAIGWPRTADTRRSGPPSRIRSLHRRSTHTRAGWMYPRSSARRGPRRRPGSTCQPRKSNRAAVRRPTGIRRVFRARERLGNFRLQRAHQELKPALRWSLIHDLGPIGRNREVIRIPRAGIDLKPNLGGVGRSAAKVPGGHSSGGGDCRHDRSSPDEPSARASSRQHLWSHGCRISQRFLDLEPCIA